MMRFGCDPEWIEPGVRWCRCSTFSLAHRPQQCAAVHSYERRKTMKTKKSTKRIAKKSGKRSK